MAREWGCKALGPVNCGPQRLTLSTPPCGSACSCATTHRNSRWRSPWSTLRLLRRSPSSSFWEPCSKPGRSCVAATHSTRRSSPSPLRNCWRVVTWNSTTSLRYNRRCTYAACIRAPTLPIAYRMAVSPTWVEPTSWRTTFAFSTADRPLRHTRRGGPHRAVRAIEVSKGAERPRHRSTRGYRNGSGRDARCAASVEPCQRAAGPHPLRRLAGCARYIFVPRSRCLIRKTRER